ncbi:hypothetical protein EsH8_IX_000730 [Colletotrichum jinshuiense]
MDISALGHLYDSGEAVCPSDQGPSTLDPELETLLTIPPRPAAAKSGPPRPSFLDLPYELRLDIYELLLLNPEPIIVSTRRRQLRVRIEPPEHQVAYLRAPRPRPRAVTLAHRKPHVEILQTSKQINLEATPVLYRKNGFIVGLKLYARDQTGVDSSDLAGFFLWHLRPATLLQLSCMTFRGACLCDHWLTLSAGACRVFAGTELVRMCADGRPGDRDCKRNGESPQPAYLQFSNSLWELEKDFGRFKLCAFCNASHRQQFFI